MENIKNNVGLDILDEFEKNKIENFLEIMEKVNSKMSDLNLSSVQFSEVLKLYLEYRKMG